MNYIQKSKSHTDQEPCNCTEINVWIAEVLVITDYNRVHAKEGMIKKFRDWTSCIKCSTSYHQQRKNKNFNQMGQFSTSSLSSESPYPSHLNIDNYQGTIFIQANLV